MQSTTGIHCKVQYGNEYRRFLNNTTQFESFLDQVKRLFSFAEGTNVLLKYKDEEGDMVTISSNEELLFAIDLFSGSVLRLVLLDQAGENFGRNFHGGHPGYGHHGFGHPGHGPFGHPGHGPFGPRGHGGRGGFGCPKGENRGAYWREKWIQKLKENPELLDKKTNNLTMKRDKIRERIETCQSEPHKHHKLEWKLKKIESRLARLQEFKNHSSDSEFCPTTETETPCQFPTLNLSKEEFTEALRQGKERREQLVKALSDGHMEMQLKKNEIQACRLQCRAGGPEGKKEIHQKIMGLKEGMCQIRQAQQQKKAELQEHDARIKNIRIQFQAQKKEQKNM